MDVSELYDYLRPLTESVGWETLSPQGRLRKFRDACRKARPDLIGEWTWMDKTCAWGKVLDACSKALKEGHIPPPAGPSPEVTVRVATRGRTGNA